MKAQPTAKRNTQYLIPIILLAAIVVYVWVFAGLAFDQHAGMRTHKADLGQVDQAIWNTSQGRFVEEIKDDFVSTRLTDHVEPFFALISPVLWLWDDVRALLLLQVIAVALGAIPLYALALEKLDQLLPAHQRAHIWHNEPLPQRRPELVEGMTRPLALAVALAWLLSPQLQSAVLTELHAIPFAAPLIVWAFWAAEKQRWLHFVVAALLLAAVKEEAALLAAGLGAWGVWRLGIGDWGLATGDRRLGRLFRSLFAIRYSPFAILLLSLAWFYLATFVIVPAHAAPVYDVAASAYFQRYGALGDSPVDILKSFFTQPELVWQIATEPARITYLWRLLAGFGLFGLLAPEILLLCLPVFLANLLSAYPAQYYGEFHYSAPIVPYFAVAGVYGLARLWRWLGRRFTGESGSYQHMAASNVGVMALVSFFTNSRSALRPLLAGGLALWLLLWAGNDYLTAGRGSGGGRYDPTPVTAHHRLLPRFTSQIPADATVTATAAIHPHLSHRHYIYQFPYGPEAAVPAEWALLDVTSNTDMAPGDVKAKVDSLLASGWGLIDGGDGFLLLRHGAPDTTIPEAFYDFARDSNAKTRSGKDAEDFANESLLNNSQFAIHHSPFSFGPLTFLGLELTDWPRWRQTKVTTLWRVEEGFVPGTVRPWVEIRTPGGATLLDSDQLPSPAQVWYPPERWQAGEVIRLESLWLFLPARWGVAVGVGVAHGPQPARPESRLPVLGGAGGLLDATGTLGLAGWFGRQADGRVAADGDEDARPADTVSAFFTTADGEQVTVAVRLESPVPAGRVADLRLEWRTENPALWQRYRVFAHLRGQTGNVAQNDGEPRFFVPIAPGPVTVDWRQLPIPAELPPGEYRLVIGLYDSATGERLAAFDTDGKATGNELSVGFIEIAASLVPDQACALIPLSCASQPFE
ncbi:MAG: DUF2079 domain-containing protein [Chloroflexi bacterium]|nr:DUF2079 domain-containing protein [Chloroflexota bacterium]